MTVKTFGELEAAIMRVVWNAPKPVSIQVVLDSLARERPPAYTTVMTVTERLREKGWLTRVRHGRSYRYSATRSADDYTAQLMGQALDASVDRARALARFARQLGPAEAEALRTALGRRTDDAAPGEG
ncbi:MAG TPA: BlaI/MecI/CopY family transcriptional regulator [Yinghuangia sp.]|uniref:BlaI/MecI/CopY family transcriptional regulator n=1 Tax=Yinghuangia sp. YIM S10712 TaxID=3436930 RepID=UPI002BA370BB|nr:BlaI/MecI/CopY family transcriptional regulator [Yinghuangia sp.]